MIIYSKTTQTLMPAVRTSEVGVYVEEKHLQLDSAEEGTEEAHHAQELYTTQVLHNELFTHIRDAI